MLLARRARIFLHPRRDPFFLFGSLRGDSNVSHLSHASDASGIPSRPTWSVYDLLSSYPAPKLSDKTFHHLHQLAALEAPESVEESFRLKQELQDLVKLVEAVKLVDTHDVRPVAHKSVEPSQVATKRPISSEEKQKRDQWGRNLLRYASRTKDGYYVVDLPKRNSSHASEADF